jgi:hypothetical protein
VTADGNIVIPIDAASIGFWLKAALGAPTTAGTTTKTHTFQSGNWTLPSLAIETGMPEVPRHAMYAGCKLDSLNWQMGRSGLLTATASVVAQGESVVTTSPAVSQVDLSLTRFGHFNGSIKRNRTAIANVVTANLNYANSLNRIETARLDGKIDGANPSMAALTGNIVVRFADQTLVNHAINGEACTLEFGYALTGSAGFKLTAHAVYLPRLRVEIAGPQGIQATFNWQAALASDPGRMFTVVLTNTVTGY